VSKVRYPHTATGRLEDLEPLNSPRLHDRIYDEILVGGLEFRRDHAEEHREGIQLLGTLMDIHREYSEQAGPFRDLFGEYLENSGQTSERAGQFFTPPDIVDMMVRSMLPDTDLGRPEPFTICDPACGTGRFMLRTAAYFEALIEQSLKTSVSVEPVRRETVQTTLGAIT